MPKHREKTLLYISSQSREEAEGTKTGVAPEKQEHKQREEVLLIPGSWLFPWLLVCETSVTSGFGQMISTPREKFR